MLVRGKSEWNKIVELFGRFNSADKYVFSVPMWNFGIPYILKHYIDLITQPALLGLSPQMKDIQVWDR